MARGAETERALAPGSSRQGGPGEFGGHIGLAHLARIDGDHESLSAAGLDARLHALSALEGELERALGMALEGMGRSRAWQALRFAGVGHYAEERLGLSRSTAENRVRLRRALARYGEVARAYESEQIGQEAALLIVRLLDGRAATTECQRRWVARAREATVKRLRDEVRAHSREAVADRAPTGPPAPLDDGAWHRSLHRSAGEARRRVARLARAELHAHQAAWPALGSGFTSLSLRLSVTTAADFAAAIDAAALEAIGAGAPQPDHDGQNEAIAPQLAETFSRRGQQVPPWVGLLALLEDYVATWDDPRAQPRKGAQRIYVRDGWRCMAPGCTSRSRLEEHHVRYRSRGGGNEPGNRICLCRFHHQRGEHGGLLRCRGRAPLGVVWGMGKRGSDGVRLGGTYRNELRLDVP